MAQKDEILLKRIANHQILHGSSCRGLGILNGKMGIALFFFFYARHTGNVIYENFAGEIVDEIIQGLHNDLPIRFSDGLCGIGWGIEFLIQNAFIEGDSDEILEELDYKIMERDLRRITDFSFETGLEGIACYVYFRSAAALRQRLPFDRRYMNDLEEIVQEQHLTITPDPDRIFNAYTL